MKGHYFRIVLFTLLVLAIPGQAAAGQAAVSRPPVSMMVLIDNSCSMFPANQIVAGCDAWGSDVNFLRITGASLFIARLGFGEPNEADYQLGVISVGDEPVLVSPLKPLAGVRDSLARLITAPKAQPATRMLPALEMAYSQIKTSTAARPGNTPAVVMITDGVPWPRENQSDAAIEDLVSNHTDTQLFVMLLQNKEKDSSDYQNYIRFWQDLQSRYPHVFVYSLHDATEIQNTYNAILAQLQNTIPAESSAIKARKPLQFYVSNYLSRIVITVVRQNPRVDAGVTITDARKVKITAADEGVHYFKGSDNPVDVYSIDAARLDLGGRGQFWTISTTRDATILIDRQGAYSINVISPAAAASATTNLVTLAERQSPTEEVRIRFTLLDGQGNPVLEPQPISGTLVLPDGKSVALKDLAGLKPDVDGIYDFGLKLSILYPAVEATPGRFSVLLNAGTIAETGSSARPVSNIRIQMDAGKLPYIRSVAPLPVTCEAGQPFSLRVSIGDYSTVVEDSIAVTLAYQDEVIPLERKEPGTYQADLQGFCSSLARQQICSTQQNLEFTIQLDAQIQANQALEPVTRQIQGVSLGPACTPTPIPTLTPTVQPTATPAPDTDQDGLLDLEDRCPNQRGWKIAEGCIPWAALITGLGILGLAGFTSSFLITWIKVRTFARPPEGYLVALRDGAVEVGPVGLRDLGLKRRTSRIVVGSDGNLAHIYLPGLKPVEFYIERKSIVSFLREPGQKKGFAFLDDTVKLIHSSDPRLVFKVSLKPDHLQE